MLRIHILLFVFFTFGFTPIGQAQHFYDVNNIQDIEIQFSQSNWDYILDTAKLGNEGYTMATWVKINGVQFDSVGIKYKGNSTYDSTNAKNPLHINLDKYKEQNYQGYKDIKLSNGYGDPSCIREVLGYNILKNYMHCPKSNFVTVTINGTYYGLFSSAESIDNSFLSDHFYSSKNTFVKGTSTLSPSAAQKNTLKYINADSNSYMATYELKSDTGWSSFIDLCNTVTNQPTSIASVLDMDRAIWMLAFNNLFVNLDSYSGVYGQNHYVYQDHTGLFNFIVWDLNMCFGSFPYAGYGTIGLGLKSLTELKEYSPYAHATETSWPVINAVQSDTSYKRKYLAHLKTMITEHIINGAYQTTAAQYQTLIDNAVSTDSNKFFSYAQFQNGLTTDVPFGTFTVPGISNLMEARKTYLMALPELTAQEPILATPTFSNNAPTLNTVVTINVSVTNAFSNSVYMGYRFDVRDHFSQLLLFDDGAHNDGAAGDLVFGNSLNMSGADLQYYLYAENSSIGKFLPARAEHEYLHLYAASVAPTAGALVINEVLTVNVGGQKDEYNDTEDWIELYNNSTNVIDLSNTYLSNSPLNVLKWKFPNHTYILPQGYLTVWADDDSMQQILHTNFNLDKDTGHVVLSDASANILDSISFTGQTQNVSYGRYPNGTGSFILMGTTFGYENNNWPLSVNQISAMDLLIFPNPAHQQLNIRLSSEDIQSLEVYTTVGQLVLQQKLNSTSRGKTMLLDISSLSNGLYLLKVNNQMKQFIKN